MARYVLLLVAQALLASALQVAEMPTFDSEKFSKERTNWETTFNVKVPPMMKNETCTRMIETLRNDGNGAAYLGSMHIGGKQLNSVIWDTGSDQQVVNSVRTRNFQKPCLALADADEHCYNAFASGEYERLDDQPTTISYGSGDTIVLTGTDTIGLKGGKCLVQNMPFYELLATDIDPILNHELDVVAGLAPNRFTGLSLTKTMDVHRFSFCFNRDTQKDGMLVWQDVEPMDNTGFKFFSAPVSGSGNYWTIQAKDLSMNAAGSNEVIGCGSELGCKMIIDTGTSLITLDSASLKNLEKKLESFDKEKLECNEENLAKFPTITMKVGEQGHELVLRPEDYIMYTDTMEAQMPKPLQDAKDYISAFFPEMAKVFENMKGQKKCMLMFTEPMEDGVLLLGMPTFRNYYVTFDRWHQRVNFAAHDGNCKPPSASFRQRRDVQRLQRIDFSKVRYSNAYYHHQKLSLNLKQKQRHELELKQKQKSVSA